MGQAANDPTPTRSDLRERFEAALRCEPGARAAWLDRHCTGADERRAIERMLEADALDTGHTIDRSVEDLLDRIGEDDTAPPIGARIGPFVLVEKLGEGGSSIVFRAQRTQDDVVQQVALKVLRHHLYTPGERRRFRDERRALGQLRHAGIARLIEGGITDSGTPYIALELIEGETLLTHARRQRLDIGGRLRLFVDVCRAVEAAHRALIVHRDLKPSNVLVGADGDVKLLDFGIAKLLDLDDDDATHTQHRAMTPAYAAPEQLRGGPITTATDVYALGILLCELITGQRRSVGDTHTPSSEIDNAAAPDLLPAPPARMRRLLRGDLDNIVLQATAEEPDRRYASAGALADDVERHLASAPVAAHPPSRWYRTRKFVARHRGGVVTTAALMLAIVGTLGIAIRQAHLARSEAMRAGAMRDFMVSSFREAQPGSPREGPPRITDVVEAAVARARDDATMHPGIRAELLSELGAVLREQGRLDTARDTLQWNYDRARRDFGDNDRLTLGAGLELLRVNALTSDHDEGARRFADDLLARIPSGEPRLRSEVLVMSTSIATRERQFDRALREGREAVAVARRLDDPHLLSNALNGYSQTLFGSGDAAGAAAPSEEALALTQARVGTRHVSVSTAHVNLSRVYRRAGDLAAAERHIQTALDIDDAVLPADDWRRALHLNAKVMILRQQREFAAALDTAIESLRINRLALGDDHPYVANDLLAIGTLRMRLGDFDGALAPLRESLEVSEAAQGPDHRQTAITRGAYGEALAGAGNARTAETEMQRALASLEAEPQPDLHEQALIRECQARLRLDRGELAHALSALIEIDRLLAGMAKPKPYWDGRPATLRATVLIAQGNGPGALELLENASAALRASVDKDVELDTEIQLQQARAAQLGGDHDAASRRAAQALNAMAALRSPPARLAAIASALRAAQRD